jgi:histidine ammonia-lyase
VARFGAGGGDVNDRTVVLDRRLSLADFVAVARGGARVALSDAARGRLDDARALVERMVADGDPVYGVNTGFGKFQSVRIPTDKLRALQRNLVLSHAIGVGPPFPTEVVRGMLLLRAQSLALGASGVRALLVERLLALLNGRVHPVVPSQGSVGASGDLAPLAHLALALIGEGEVEHGGALRPAADALAEVGISPLELEAKEGLALVNGTQAMASLLALVLVDAAVLVTAADVAAAMTVEALKGSHRPFDEAVTRLRPHPGAIEVAGNLRSLLRDSAIAASHADCDKVQDAYSLRAAPQVHGAVRDALRYANAVLEVEFASVTDNPLLLVDEGRAVSAGNFHGEPLALAADHVKVALAELANISERRDRADAQPRAVGAAGVPGRRRRPRLGPDGQPVHGRRAGQREQGARPPGVGRLHPHQRQPGGPRLDGDDRLPPGARGAGERHLGHRHRGDVGGAGARLPRRPRPGRGRRRGPRARAIGAAAPRARRLPAARARPGARAGARRGAGAGGGGGGRCASLRCSPGCAPR